MTINKRYITGAILIPITFAILILPPAKYFTYFTMIMAFLAYSEFVTMFNSKKQFVFLPAAAIMMIFIYTVQTSIQLATFDFILIFLFVPLFSLLGNNSAEEKMKTMTVHLSGFFYLSIPFSLFPLLREYTPNKKLWLIFALVIPWICDSAAYFFGKKFGKHKFAPQISPKKTWEGTIAGLIFSIIAGLIYAYFVFKGKYLLFAGIIGALSSTFGQLGDLVESLFKRGAKVKDSGTIFPGHGGILDRTDSLLYSVTIVYLGLKFMEYYAI